MRYSPAYEWRKYKTDFLRVNRCTANEFEQAYIVFQAGNPSIDDYHKFAKKYGITIMPHDQLPAYLQVVLCVNISAIKVMAKTYEESLAALNDILDSIKPNTE